MLKLLEKYSKEVEEKYPIKIGFYEDKEFKSYSLFISYQNKFLKLNARKMFNSENKTLLTDEQYVKIEINQAVQIFIAEIKGVCNSTLKEFQDEVK